MSKLKHKGRDNLSPKDREKFDAVRADLLKMNTESADDWIDKNVKNTKDAQQVLKILVRAVSALAKG